MLHCYTWHGHRLCGWLRHDRLWCYCVCVCRRFAVEFHQLGLPLNVLVNNAGVHLKVSSVPLPC